MYLEYFGLKKQPFQLTPDANFLFLSQGHKRAKAYMDYTVWNRDGFVVITGEIGSGKTTLIQSLLSSVDNNVLIARIYQTQLDEVEFFQAILVEFGFKPFNATKVELLEMLNQFLLEQYRMGRQVILIIDEAQNLSRRVLEEVRMLTGMETHHERILNLILVGQPELKQLLDAPGMEQLCQRIRFRFHLNPLELEDIPDYIHHRLETAGYSFSREETGISKPLFLPETYPVIYTYTGGIPRLINALCDTALISAFVEEKKHVDEELMALAVDELQWVPYHERAGIKSLNGSSTENHGTHLQPRLIQYSGHEQIASFDIHPDTTTIGRLPSNDVYLNVTSVSMHHAKIVRFHGNYFIEDLRSTNGTYINGHRVSKCVLKPGDRLAFAQVIMEFQLQDTNPDHPNLKVMEGSHRETQQESDNTGQLKKEEYENSARSKLLNS